MIRHLALALALFGSGGIGSAHAAQAVDIGMPFALTGYLASFDGHAMDGAKLAAKVLNAKGGIAGHPIDLHVLDNTSNAATGVTVVNELINRYDVNIIASGALSAQTLAIAPIVARNKIPVVTMSVIPPAMPWTFSIALPPSKMLDLELDFTAHRLKAKRIAFLYSQTPYGQRGGKIVVAAARKYGLQTVFNEGVAVDATDLTPQIAKLKASRPDAIVDFLTGPVHIVEAKAATTVGLAIPIVMGIDDVPTFLQSAAIYHDCYFLLSPIQAYPNVPDPKIRAAAKQFLDAFKTSGLDEREIGGAGEGWDLLHVAASALSSPAATSGAKLQDALLHLDYVGAYGRFEFRADDHTGQLNEPTAMQVAHLRNGKLQIVGVDQH